MKKQSWLLAFVVLGLLGASSLFLHHLQNRQRVGQPGVKVAMQPLYDPKGKIIATNSVDFPADIPGYKSELLPITDKELTWLPKDTTYGRRLYRADDGTEMMLGAILMGRDRTSIHKPEYCLPSQGWQIDPAASRLTTIRVGRPYPYDLPVTAHMLTRDYKSETGEARTISGVYVYWFVAENRLTGDHKQRMWWMALDLLRTGVLQRWAYISVFSPCPVGQEEATYERMKKLIAASVPEFQLTHGKSADTKLVSSSTQ